MAIIRRFGPSKGAGVVVVEKPPGEQISAAATGVVTMVGPFERGEISTASVPAYNRCPTKRDFERIMGGRVSGLVTPDVAQDFYDHGQGAGEIIAIRLADGTQKTSELTLYSKHWGTDFGAPESEKDNQSQIKQAVLKVEAKNAGRWGGQERFYRGETLVASIAATTLTDSDAAWVVNEWTGATLTLGGVADKTYTVISNTATVLTVQSDADMDADLGASADGSYTVEMSQEVLTDGTPKGLYVVAREGEVANTFRLTFWLDGADSGLDYPKLSLDNDSEYNAEKIINEDPSNHLVKVTILWSGTVTPDTMPANYYGRLQDMTTTKATFNVGQIVSVDDSNVQIVGIDAPTVGRPFRYTFKWVDATTLYTVTAEDLSKPGFAAVDLPDFSVGTGEQLNAEYDADIAFVPKVRVDHAASPADETEFVIEVHPIPTDAADLGAELAGDAKSNPLARHRVKSTTLDSATIETGNLCDVATAPQQGVVAGTVEGPYNIQSGVNDAMLLEIDGRKEVSVTLTAGATQTAFDIVDDINDAFDAIFGVGVLNPALISTFVPNQDPCYTPPGGGGIYGDTTVALMSAWFEGGGPSSTVEIKTVANDAYTDLGLSVGITRGEAGSEFQLFFPDRLTDGFNGGAPDDNKYLEALSIGATPLNDTTELGLGVMQILCPGVTSTTIQKAGIALGEAKNHMFVVEIPSNYTDESAVVGYINDTIGRSDFGLTYFPTYVDVPDPDKSGLTKTIPVTGQITGRDAYFARLYEGYYRPAAGLDATLPRIVKLPTLDRKLNEELLNPQGINVIKKKKGNYVIWGGRTINKSSAFQWKTHRLQLSHYEHTFLQAFDYVIFALNNATTRQELITTLRIFFAGEYAKGAIVGPTLNDAARIKIDDENNPPASVEAGDLNAEVLIKLVNFIERFIITIGKQGIFEGTT